MAPAAESISFAGDFLSLNHTEQYLQLIRVKELHYRARHGMGEAELQAALDSLGLTADSRASKAVPHLGFAFTTNNDGSTHRVKRSEIHGALLLSGSTGSHRYSLDYYERSSTSDSLRRIESISCQVGAPLQMDLIRALHFAPFDPRDRPTHSTIYEFSADSFEHLTLSEPNDLELRLHLLDDQSRWGGLDTVGLNGRDLYDSVLLPLPPDRTQDCSSIPDCQAGANECVKSPIAGYTCQEVTPPSSGFSAIARAWRRSKTPVFEQIGFGALALLYGMLRRSPEGREYIASYYVASAFLKIDSNSLMKYQHALPHFNRAVKVLLAGSDDDVVVTRRLRDVVAQFVRDHRDAGHPRMHRVLDLLERDVNRFVDQPRSRVMDALDLGDLEITSD